MWRYIHPGVAKIGTRGVGSCVYIYIGLIMHVNVDRERDMWFQFQLSFPPIFQLPPLGEDMQEEVKRKYTENCAAVLLAFQ
jgi:hypothetical protein